MTKDKWDDVFTKSIYEFFNLVSYSKHKTNKTKEQIEKWKHTN